MAFLEFCSNCGNKNTHSFIDGNNRYHCSLCGAIHYENPKPTSTILCMNNQSLLLAKRAFDPGKGEWGLPGGFLELNETLSEGTMRELKEETNLDGEFMGIVGTCSHYGTIFGDILLIGVEVFVRDFSHLKAGDDAQEVSFFPIDNLPDIAFDCHQLLIDKFILNLD